MVDVKFNLNNKIKVRLKKRGLDILRHQHDERNRRLREHGGKGV